MAMPSNTATCTIPAGQSISAPCNVTGGNPVWMTLPPDWDFTLTNLITFQMSMDGTNYYDLFRPDGTEFSAIITPGACLLIPTDLNWLPWIKIRSGPRSNPVPRTADRTFTIALA